MQFYVHLIFLSVTNKFRIKTQEFSRINKVKESFDHCRYMQKNGWFLRIKICTFMAIVQTTDRSNSYVLEGGIKFHPNLCVSK